MLVWRNDGRTVYVFAILPQRPVCMIIDEWIIIKMKRVGYDEMERQFYHRIFVNWESVAGCASCAKCHDWLRVIRTGKL